MVGKRKGYRHAATVEMYTFSLWAKDAYTGSYQLCRCQCHSGQPRPRTWEYSGLGLVGQAARTLPQTAGQEPGKEQKDEVRRSP